MGLIRTRLASDADRPALIEFIRDHWSARHVFVADPAVFDWQYRQADGRINMMLAERLEDDASANILGVLGFIPMGRFDPALGDRDIMLALWKVRDDIAPPGLGLRLLKAIQAQLQPRIIGAIGISEMVGPIYRALGYQLDHLCQAAVMNPMAQDRLRLAQGVPADAFATAAPPAQFALRDLDPARDAGLVAALAARGSLQKSWDYLRERYLDHPWYDYDLRLVMQGDRPEAVVIWRAVEAQGARILRIVDVIGGTDWLGEAAALLRPELVAAGAEYIDIMACGLDEDMLRAGGLVSPDWCPGLILPNYFAPYEPRNIRIALAWKNFGPETADKAPMRLFRADSDQDRPNQPMPRRTAAPIPQES
ncbi:MULTISPECIES: hypothetical protein [unclassified Paracoccus (in: a-proteobacteria)]|uniref:hypothetical protein n=1 Tax=unclassified Paracoccus (in: a-proteobacteria) TaxID=2688777 RepID=UPI0012B3C1D4|nr:MULTISPECIES: hypothetical protein [unclassified Paracoccus (in: a-proteobacteria)]UXU74433.1 hypothetical protein GB879_011050 [Paracoccus sp. SMMA_5]UXU80323.1 hypothetical protein GB880_011025 [Paracoccus sp. SMMA_5_TC]